MANILHISDNFYKYKDVLTRLFIDYYGEEYADIIKNRIDLLCYDFSSIPNEEYKFVQNNKNQFDVISKLLTTLNYKDFSIAQKRFQKVHNNIFMKYIQSKWSIESIDENGELLPPSPLFLFTDASYEKGYIDYFSSKFIQLLNDPSIPEEHKDYVRGEQETVGEILQSYGIHIEDISSVDVDELIEYRNRIKDSYQKCLVEKTLFGKKIDKIFRKVMGFQLPSENLSSIALSNKSFAGYIRVDEDDDSTYYQFIKIPLLHLMNHNLKTLDVNLIHELIHKIETYDNYVGIAYHRDEVAVNVIANEIRTQILAINFAKQLHKLGFFIFDNPDDYKYENESAYESLFPLTKDFFDKYEEVFSYCAMNHSPQQLVEYFGESFSDFSSLLDEIYYDHIYFYSRAFGECCTHSDERITE